MQSLYCLMLCAPQLATQLLDDMAQEYLEQVYRCVFDDELTAEARSVALAVYIDSAEVNSKILTCILSNVTTVCSE
jgi:hypothetical protein